MTPVALPATHPAVIHDDLAGFAAALPPGRTDARPAPTGADSPRSPQTSSRRMAAPTAPSRSSIRS